jgi:hypothetical protein
MPAPLVISRVSVLKNSNVLGTDVFDYDILMYNLNKVNKEYNSSFYYPLGMVINSNKQMVSYDFAPNETINHIIEIPICLNRSYLCSSLIKD